MGEEDDEEIESNDINNDINEINNHNIDIENTNMNKHINNNGVPPQLSVPEYNFSLHMESYTAGTITHSALSRYPDMTTATAVSGTTDTTDTTDIGDSIHLDHTQMMSHRSQQKEFKMEDFPVFPSHNTHSIYQQNEWPVRYQSSNMPTSGFFHVTPPPPHVAFDEAALQLDAKHHLNIDMPVSNTSTDMRSPSTNGSPHSNNSNNSPNRTYSPGVSSVTTTLPCESVSSSAFSTPIKTAEKIGTVLSRKTATKNFNDKGNRSLSESPYVPPIFFLSSFYFSCIFLVFFLYFLSSSFYHPSIFHLSFFDFSSIFLRFFFYLPNIFLISS